MTKILHSLKTKSLFIFTLTILPSFIAAFIIFRYAERTKEASLYARLQTESQNIAGDVLRWVNKRIADLRMMSDFIEPAPTSGAPINEYLATMKKYYPNYERIVFVNLTGEIIADTANPPSRELSQESEWSHNENRSKQKNYRDSIWFQKTMEKGEYVSDIFWKEQKPMLIISVIKRRESKPAGVLCAFIRLKYLGNLVNDTLFGKSRKSYLVNHDGIIIASNGIIIASKGNEQTNISEMENDVGAIPRRGTRFIHYYPSLTQGERYATYIDYRGVKVIGVKTSIPKLQWFSIVEQDAGEVFARLNWYKAGICVLFLLMSCTVISVYFLFSRSIINPIEKLADAATAITKGNFHQRVEPLPSRLSIGDALVSSHRDNEVGRLIDAFNNMAQKLGSYCNKLENKIADAKEKLEKTDNELKRGREALARSEALIALGELSAGIAHEIRTPLTSIKLFIQSLENELPLDDEQSRAFAIIKGEIDRMEETVRRFLDFARTAEPKFEMMDINQIISDAVSLVKTRIKGKGISIEINTEKLPLISGDKKQLVQVFLNLFLNSIEAMSDSGKIAVSAHLDEDEKSLIITVADTGCGIDTDELPYIFNPFFTTKETGTGMGLAIVHNAIEQHGGNIEVESQVKKGTKFTISLPIAKEVQIG